MLLVQQKSLRLKSPFAIYAFGEDVVFVIQKGGPVVLFYDLGALLAESGSFCFLIFIRPASFEFCHRNFTLRKQYDFVKFGRSRRVRLPGPLRKLDLLMFPLLLAAGNMNLDAGSSILPAANVANDCLGPSARIYVRFLNDL